MALRTFHFNPSLGGFGGGETADLLLPSSGKAPLVTRVDGDAFAQIVKELVDNSVDACTLVDESRESVSSRKRVRVVIEPYKVKLSHTIGKKGDCVREYKSGECSDNGANEILRVTVSDNGIGMQDIQACVEAFRTSKAHESSNIESQTSGRYGIGLTLCLLHAQRLVPNSCASIQSATRKSECWNSTLYVVDTEGDSMKCIQSESRKKAHADESGTSGGSGVSNAWPRLAEYFARFRLSNGLKCGIEVFAPTLSQVPLHVSPDEYAQQSEGEQFTQEEDDSAWNDPFEHNDEENHIQSQTHRLKVCDMVIKRQSLQKAFTRYLGKTVSFENIAHTTVPIRNDSDGSLGSLQVDRPLLEVNMVVQGSSEECQSDEDDEETTNDERDGNEEDRDLAKLVLVRMVNHIPLLDGEEAAACGLVRGIAAKTHVWNSFGLSTNYQYNQQADAAKLLQFSIRDSNQVIPFLIQRNHALLPRDSDDDSSYSGSSRRKRPKRIKILPAHARLGNILVIVHIHAKPTNLPLPTLSKGRLPAENKAIDDSLEVALTSCLRQLQKTNPSLFLTPAELRKAEREACYIPAVSNALANILNCQQSDHLNLIRTIQLWETVNDEENERPNNNEIEALIENRFRGVLKLQARKKPTTMVCSKRRKAALGESNSEDSDLDDAFQSETNARSLNKSDLPIFEVNPNERLLVETMMDDLMPIEDIACHRRGDRKSSCKPDPFDDGFMDWL